jgi:hypothetical protein
MDGSRGLQNPSGWDRQRLYGATWSESTPFQDRQGLYGATWSENTPF